MGNALCVGLVILGERRRRVGEGGLGAYLRNSKQDSKFMILAFAFECSNVRTFDFIDVMNSHIAIHNYLFIFRLLFTFKHVGWVKKQMQLQKIT